MTTFRKCTDNGNEVDSGDKSAVRCAPKGRRDCGCSPQLNRSLNRSPAIRAGSMCSPNDKVNISVVVEEDLDQILVVFHVLGGTPLAPLF